MLNACARMQVVEICRKEREKITLQIGIVCADLHMGERNELHFASFDESSYDVTLPQTHAQKIDAS